MEYGVQEWKGAQTRITLKRQHCRNLRLGVAFCRGKGKELDHASLTAEF